MQILNKVLTFFGLIPEAHIGIKCNHEWTNYGFSDIQCKKCDKIEYNPEMSTKIRNIHVNALFQNRGLNDDEQNKIKNLKHEGNHI